jgi:hypothetical protein
MTTHTDTASLRGYTSGSYPNLPGGDQRFIQDELRKLQNAIGQIVTAMKLLEARMNTNGLT